VQDNQGIASRVYYGIPRFVGEWFRATKIPSIILLSGMLGVPILLSIVTVVCIVGFHSGGPMTLFALGVLEHQIDKNPNVVNTMSPQLKALLQTASPAAKQWGRHFFEAYIVLGFVLAIACFWWIRKTLTFLSDRTKKKTP